MPDRTRMREVLRRREHANAIDAEAAAKKPGKPKRKPTAKNLKQKGTKPKPKGKPKAKPKAKPRKKHVVKIGPPSR